MGVRDETDLAPASRDEAERAHPADAGRDLQTPDQRTTEVREQSIRRLGELDVHGLSRHPGLGQHRRDLFFSHPARDADREAIVGVIDVGEDDAGVRERHGIQVGLPRLEGGEAIRRLSGLDAPPQELPDDLVASELFAYGLPRRRRGARVGQIDPEHAVLDEHPSESRHDVPDRHESVVDRDGTRSVAAGTASTTGGGRRHPRTWWVVGRRASGVRGDQRTRNGLRCDAWGRRP